MTTTDPAPVAITRQAAKRRIALYIAAGFGAALDLAAKAWAQNSLPGHSIGGGIIDLQLAYNPGVAFSLGNSLPSWAVVAFTGLITAVAAIAAWRIAPRGNWLEIGGLAAVLAGASANLIDRALNGHVTDYLHTGWWPTFNLADVLIVCGALIFALSYLRAAKIPAGREEHAHGGDL